MVTSRDGRRRRHHRGMDTPPQVDLPTPDPVDNALTRRGFLRGAALAGGGLVAVGLAACAPAAAPGLDVRPDTARPPPRRAERGRAPPAPRPSAAAASAAPSHDMSAQPDARASASASGGPVPAGWTEHDVAARDVVRRYLGNLVAGAQGHLRRRSRSPRWPTILGAADDYPQLDAEAGLRAGPEPVPERRGQAAQARARRRRQGLPPDDRRDRAAHRRDPAADRGPRLQRPVAGPDDPGHPGRQGPGDLHQQPEGDHRRPLPRRRVRRLLPGRRPVRDPAPDHARRDVHLRVHGQERRLADVPLAPQRHRPGRARAAGGVHRRSEAGPA